MIWKFFSVVITLMAFLSTNARAALINGWNVRLVEPVRYEKELVYSQEVKIYTGDWIVQEVKKSPEAGKQFALVHVSIQRQDVNAPAFNPNLFVIKINQNTFKRLDDDVFLSDFSLKPLPHLNIKRGSYDGYLLYEIPADTQNASVFYDTHALPIDK